MLDQRCDRLRRAAAGGQGLSDAGYELLDRAAGESLDRIQLDRAGAPENLQPVFAYIERYLFDPTLSVSRLKKALVFRDNSFSTQFGDACGRTPRGYIEDRRCEIACRLLAGSDLTTWEISELVGFKSPQCFTRALRRWAGKSPGLYRKEARRRPGGGRTVLPPGGGGRFSDRECLRRAVAGELPAHEAWDLIDWLRRLYPSSRR